MEIDPRIHFVTATAIIVRKSPQGKLQYLIAKRSPREKAFPSRWTVPGGKLVSHEYKDLPKTSADAWYNIIEWLLRKEIREEVGLEIKSPNYLVDLAFVRPDGYPVITLSYWCWLKSGTVKLCKDLTDYAWIEAKQAKDYDLISGIDHEIDQVEDLIKKSAHAH